MVDVSDREYVVAVMPINPDRGYPQTANVGLRGNTYRVTYDFLAHDGSMVMYIVRMTDMVEFWRGKVVKKYPWRIKDPTTGEYALGFYAQSIDKENPVIYVWVAP